MPTVRYPLAVSLAKYAELLPDLIFQNNAEFDALVESDCIGCFCEHAEACHTYILLQEMKQQYPGRTQFPHFQCMKVKYLRKAGYSDLRQWLGTPGNTACVRGGRIFIKTPGEAKAQIFHYSGSTWMNPFRVSNAK